MGRVKHSRLLAAGGVSLLAAAAVSSVVAPSAAMSSAAVTANVPTVPVTHVIEIMIENHSFDNLFGKFPGADGIPAHTSLLNPNAYFDSAPTVTPVWATGNEGDVNGEINNSTVAEQMAMDYQPSQGYLMDHYTVFPQDGMAAITEFGPAPPASTGYGARTPMIIISPYARHGVYHQQTTNVSILSFMQKLWGLPALTPLNASQNDLFSAFNFSQAPLAAPSVPVAPTDTIGFHGPGGILTDIDSVSPGRSLTINLEAETGGLVLDSTVNGPVALTLSPPPGVAVPSSFPSSVRLSGGQADITTSFPSAGYWRIAASGPGGSQGWVTVDVGVTPDTAP
jgi:phospholipase C